MNKPDKLRTHTCTAVIRDDNHATLISEQLLLLNGVLEVVIILEEQAVYIKVNNQVFALEKAKDILKNS
jgi:high-affinity nickel permease